MVEKADIGLAGLAVMGQNLALNMMNKGYSVAVWNRSQGTMEQFVAERAAGKPVIGAKTLEELVQSLKRPRKIMLMIKAGAPVDGVIEQLVPLLDEGDLIIDGGNSYFEDSIRRDR